MLRQFISSGTYPVAETKTGKLRGFVLDGIFTFHGIKYADAKRFQAPQPVKSWEGIKDATNYGYICPVVSSPAPKGELLIPHRFWPADENCQYLNIWSPGIGEDKKRPVMVWFHGGGYADGSSIEQVAYEGDKLARYGDVVVVTVNHRLNLLGFLDMSSFGEKYANSANAGMADLVAALGWIHENIAAFGGDPDNVLIFGQSGGGGKVQTLLNTPAAEGLFHKAVLMSGVFDGDNGEAPDHRPLIEAMLRELNIPAGEVERFEKVPVDILYRAFNKVSAKLSKEGVRIGWEPRANEWYRGNPLRSGFSDFAKKVPTMAGSVIAEFAGFASGNDNFENEEDVIKAVKGIYGGASDRIIKLYKDAYPGKPLKDLLYKDRIFRPVTKKFIEKKAEVSSAPAYLYEFALDFDVNGGIPAWHCSDIPFVFHNCERVGCCNIEGVTDTLEDQVAGAYVNFAYTGNPNHPGMPKWEAYSGKKHPTMVFDRVSRCSDELDTALLAAIDEVLPPVNLGDLLKNTGKAEADGGKEEKGWMY